VKNASAAAQKQSGYRLSAHGGAEAAWRGVGVARLSKAEIMKTNVSQHRSEISGVIHR